MEQSIFWEKLAKLVSSNAGDEEIVLLKSIIDTESHNARALRDASLIFGKSQKDIQESFDRLTLRLSHTEKSDFS